WPRTPARASTPSSPSALRSGATGECPRMDHETYPDAYLRDILTGVRTIAVVGASPRRERPSHGVMAYLQRRGYRTIPVNPTPGPTPTPIGATASPVCARSPSSAPARGASGRATA